MTCCIHVEVQRSFKKCQLSLNLTCVNFDILAIIIKKNKKTRLHRSSVIKGGRTYQVFGVLPSPFSVENSLLPFTIENSLLPFSVDQSLLPFSVDQSVLRVPKGPPAIIIVIVASLRRIVRNIKTSFTRL